MPSRSDPWPESRFDRLHRRFADSGEIQPLQAADKEIWSPDSGIFGIVSTTSGKWTVGRDVEQDLDVWICLNANCTIP